MRSLVERGLSLKKAAKQFGMSYSAVQARSALEGWKFHGRGRPRILDHLDGSERVQIAKREAQYEEAQAALQREAGVLVLDLKKAELLAQKVLAQHSVRMKVALSELVVQTALDLRSPEVKPKDRALAMVALKTVCDRLFGWDREPEIQSMKLARKGGDDVPTVAVNLALIATTPQKLAEMAKAKFDQDDHAGDRFSKDSGPSATESDVRLTIASPITPEQPRTVTHRRPIPEKEAPTPPLEGQSAKGATAGDPPVSEKPQQPPDWFERIAHPPPLAQSSLSPQEGRRHQLEELPRLRAEWRGR
jgi:hypothetical protein